MLWWVLLGLFFIIEASFTIPRNIIIPMTLHYVTLFFVSTFIGGLILLFFIFLINIFFRRNI